ncbi:HNH endonuclease (plasmid) [Coraliomargarita sp. W4R53]
MARSDPTGRRRDLRQATSDRTTARHREVARRHRHADDMVARNSRRARAQRRRTKRVASSGSDLTDAQWVAISVAWAKCAYCAKAEGPFQRDCVLPISRGGRYTIDNVVPACRSCNASKSNDEVTSWMRRKRLDEPAFLIRFREVVIEITASETEIALAPALPGGS